MSTVSQASKQRSRRRIQSLADAAGADRDPGRVISVGLFKVVMETLDAFGSDDLERLLQLAEFAIDSGVIEPAEAVELGNV